MVFDKKMPYLCGFWSFAINYHRYVKKGEKGIRVIAPVTTKKEVETDKMDPSTGQPVRDADGNPVKEKKTVIYRNFKMTSVFDVSQTEGEPLPALGVHQLEGHVTDYDRFMDAMEELSPVPISFGQVRGEEVKGFYDAAEKKIVIRQGMSELQTMKTLIHEVAHSLLHSREQMETDGVQKDRQTKEVEAESVAYTVCQMFGLDTSEYSFPYIASWSSGKDMKELKASMDTIRRTAGTMIESIDVALEGHEKEHAAEPEIAEQDDDPFMTAEEDEPLPFAEAGEATPSYSAQDKSSVLEELDEAKKLSDASREEQSGFADRGRDDETCL